MRYLSDELGVAYKNWKDQMILIPTPTGSGKTTFVLTKLLPYAAQHKKYVAYFCNRKLLKKQVGAINQKLRDEVLKDAAARDLGPEEKDRLLIFSYQYFEQKGNDNFINPISGKQIDQDQIMYFIYDEADYFLRDSSFNSGCNFWYGYWERQLKVFNGHVSENEFKGVHIFLTATPEPLRYFFAAQMARVLSGKVSYETQMKQLSEYRKLYSEADRLNEFRAAEKQELLKQAADVNPYMLQHKRIQKGYEYLKESEKFREYNIPFGSPYERMKVKYFLKNETLIEHIISLCKESEAEEENYDKFLIFVNNKDDGIRMETILTQEKIDAVFISADNVTSSRAAAREVKSITETKRFTCRVLIATSIMDCGVSICDRDVKHVAVSHANKETFLQMLGRVREVPGDGKDQNKLNLYVRCFNLRELNGTWQQHYHQWNQMVEYGMVHARHGYDVQNVKNDVEWQEGPAQSSWKRAQSVSNILESNSHLLYVDKISVDKRSNENEELFWHLIPGKSAFIWLTFLINRDAEVLQQYKQENLEKLQEEYKQEHGHLEGAPESCNPEDVFYLKHQLSWLGKTFDDSNWLGQPQSKKEICDFLDSYLEKQIVPEQSVGCRPQFVSQTEFREQCQELLRRYPVGQECLKNLHKNKKFKKDNKQEKLLGFTKLNRIFNDLKLPYRLKRGQVYQEKGSKTRISAWWIIEPEAELERDEEVTSDGE